MPGALGEHGFVGGTRRCQRPAHRAARRRGTPAASAPGRSRRAAASPTIDTGASPRLTVSCARSAAIAALAPRRPLDRPRESDAAVTSGRAASWITTMSARVGDARKRVGHRILPPLAALDDLDRLARSSRRYSGGRATRLRRQRHDEVGHASLRKEGIDAALQDRNARRASRAASDARRRSGRPAPGGNDGGDVHVMARFYGKCGPACSVQVRSCRPAHVRAQPAGLSRSR